MKNDYLKNFTYLRMWPRSVFKKKEKTGKKRLLIKIDKNVGPVMKQPGVYILYKGDEFYYVGRATELFDRLHSHSNKITDDHYAHWDYFSAFAIEPNVKNPDDKVRELEAILIAAMPRATNSSTPRFKKVRIPKALLEEE